MLPLQIDEDKHASEQAEPTTKNSKQKNQQTTHE
jgi:hypothetical protein